MHQHGETERHKDHLAVCGGFGKGHPAAPAFLCANQGNDHLGNGHTKGQNQGEMCKFYQHAKNFSAY